VLKGFKDFILRGNVIDLAIAVVIGAAFTSVVTAFTDKMLRPLINSLGDRNGPGGLAFSIRHGSKEIEAATLVDVSAVITTLINFLLVAAVVYFLIVAPMNALLERRRRGEEPEVTAPSEDVLLLQEIRDLLKAQSERR
jgi:large conductance mechanosensitive channel